MTTEAVKDVAKAAAPVVEESNGVADKKKSPSGDGAPAAAAPPSKKSVPKPDEAAMKAACDELGAKIEKNKKRLEQIKNVLAERAEKKKTGGSPAMQALREKLANLREQFKTELVSWIGEMNESERGQEECGGGEEEQERGHGRFFAFSFFSIPSMRSTERERSLLSFFFPSLFFFKTQP